MPATLAPPVVCSENVLASITVTLKVPLALVLPPTPAMLMTLVLPVRPWPADVMTMGLTLVAPVTGWGPGRS